MCAQKYDARGFHAALPFTILEVVEERSPRQVTFPDYGSPEACQLEERPAGAIYTFHSPSDWSVEYKRNIGAS